MQTTHLSATLMEVLVATITTQYGITSALSVNALKNSLLCYRSHLIFFCSTIKL